MIVGIGIDLCAVPRIRQAIAILGDRFLGEVFTEAERRSCDGSRDRAELYACCFAAKEATAKALGVGIETVIRWHDIEVVASGRRHPSVRLTGAALSCAAETAPPGHTPVLHVSLAWAAATAQALVIVEAVPGLSLAG